MMGVSFKDIFINKPQFSGEPPKVIIDTLEKKLPEGFKYTRIGNGRYAVDKIENGLEIDFESIELKDDIKKVLPGNYTSEQLLQYAYNSQTKISILPKDGYYTIDGSKISAKYLVVEPLSNEQNSNISLLLEPPKFPEPFSLVLGVGDYTLDINVQRVANDSLDEFRFKSLDNQPMEIEYIVDVNEKKFEFNFKCKVRYAKNVKEVLSTYLIYNSFIDGQGYIGNSIIEHAKINSVKKIPEEAIQFWEKVYKIENKLDISFDIKEQVLEKNILDIEQIYRCIIEEKPYKTYKVYKSVIGNEMGNLSKEFFSDNQNFYFEFTGKAEYELLGKTISLQAIIGIFNSRIKDVQNKEDDQVEILLETVKDKKMYESMMLFITADDLEGFQSNQDHILTLKDAEEITYTY